MGLEHNNPSVGLTAASSLCTREPLVLAEAGTSFGISPALTGHGLGLSRWALQSPQARKNNPPVRLTPDSPLYTKGPLELAEAMPSIVICKVFGNHKHSFFPWQKNPARQDRSIHSIQPPPSGQPTPQCTKKGGSAMRFRLFYFETCGFAQIRSSKP